MPKIIAVHSFRGGTGKSNITASLSVLLASEGRRVGVIDTDIQSPGIHVLFGLKEHDIKHSLNEYLWGECTIEEAVQDVTEHLRRENQNIGKGQVFLIPSSMKVGEIARMLRERHDVDMLRDAIRHVVDALNLDVLLIDTHPGLNDETLLSIASSDELVIIMRPDQQDYQGTRITVEIARKLRVPRMMILVNKVSKLFDVSDVKTQVGQTYNCEVVAVLPYSEEMMNLGSECVFVLRYPQHPVTQMLRQVAGALMA